MRPSDAGRALVPAVLAVLLAAPMCRAGFTPEVQRALETSKHLYVASERADGSLSKISPVWFMYDGTTVLFTTAPGSWKAKRIKAGRRLHVWVGAANGPGFVSKAELSNDPVLAARMGPAYAGKYWIAWLGLFKPRPDRVQAGKTVIVKVPPPT